MSGRPVLRRLGDALDSLVGVWAPASACRRRAARSALYAAARSPRASGDWSAIDGRINDLVGASAATVRARVRQLVRDFPYFARANQVLADYVVGAGIVYQSSIRTAAEKLHKKHIQRVEDAFARWADEADVSGRLHFYELMHLAKRQENETGNYLFIRRHLSDRGRYLPLALQAVEVDWLTSCGAAVAAGNAIEQGVEYDRSTGRPVAYHLTDPDSWGKTMRIPAADVLHGYRTLRPGQLVGISDFAPGVMLARDLSQYMDTEIDAAKMAAKWVGFVTTPDIASRQLGLEVDDDDGKKLDTVENAIIEYLRPGETMNLASNNRGGNFPPMVRLILTMLSAATNVPYELLSGDYSGMNFSTGKMVRVDFAQALRPMVARHVRGFCQPVLRWFMDEAVLAGRLPFAGRYFADPAPWLRCTWQAPGMDSIDISRESKAQVDQITARLRSPQEIAAARGRDLEDIYREISEAEAMARDMGLTVAMNTISTALADNPAAVAQQGVQGDDDTEPGA